MTNVNNKVPEPNNDFTIAGYYSEFNLGGSDTPHRGGGFLAGYNRDLYRLGPVTIGAQGRYSFSSGTAKLDEEGNASQAHLHFITGGPRVQVRLISNLFLQGSYTLGVGVLEGPKVQLNPKLSPVPTTGFGIVPANLEGGLCYIRSSLGLCLIAGYAYSYFPGATSSNSFAHTTTGESLGTSTEEKKLGASLMMRW